MNTDSYVLKYFERKENIYACWLGAHEAAHKYNILFSIRLVTADEQCNRKVILGMSLCNKRLTAAHSVPW